MEVRHVVGFRRGVSGISSGRSVEAEMELSVGFIPMEESTAFGSILTE